MFWFIPMIVSALSSKMQENKNRSNQAVQNSQSFGSNQDTNGLYRNLVGNVNSTSNGQSRLYDAIMNNSNGNTNTSNSVLSDSIRNNTQLDTNTNFNNSASQSSEGLSSLGGGSDSGSGGGGAGGWMSMANSMMGMMSNNKTPQFQFTPTTADIPKLDSNIQPTMQKRFRDIWR